MAAPTEWYKSNYLVSRNNSLLQLDAIHAAFNSDLISWAKPLSDEGLKTMIDRSVCFGLYELPQSTAEISGQRNPRQIGFARLVTDTVTISYLTDVYVLKEYQGQGLGKWMIRCIGEVTSSWPELRGSLLFAFKDQGKKFYQETLDMVDFDFENGDITLMQKKGPGHI